ncbi:MAG: anti-sigma factor [Pseudomonadota bacterium]
MSDTPNQVSDDILHAFVDGQLPPADAERVEAWLNAHPDKAEEVAAWAEQNAAIDALFPAPATLPQTAATPPPRPAPVVPERPRPANSNRAPGPAWAAVAAAFAMLGIGLATGWFARGSVTPGSADMATLVREAVAAHVVYAADPHRPVEVAASEEETLIRWLSNRVGRQLTAPDLTGQGFELVGGRLLSVTEGPAAQFMYENADGRRITLFASQAATGQLASFTFNATGDERSFYWEDENLSYAIVGDVDRDSLSQLATAVFRQVN